MQPPYRGVLATIGGMTWARGAIFYGSDTGKAFCKKIGVPGALAQTLPPMLIGTAVQFVNMPLVRATITIQDPSSHLTSVRSALGYLYKTRGVSGLWHGVSAGVLKTVPKYITAVVVKDWCEDYLPRGDPNNKVHNLTRAAVKSVAAGIAGAALTNPLDVLRNEMFKTDLGLTATYKKLMKEEGWRFTIRGMASNVTAVAIPIAMTIFMTDVLISYNF
jgi:Mitochondrial carrier protein